MEYGSVQPGYEITFGVFDALKKQRATRYVERVLERRSRAARIRLEEGAARLIVAEIGCKRECLDLAAYCVANSFAPDSEVSCSDIHCVLA